ncbi:unnamed protein product [Rhodiola kirilowii]
MACVSSLHSLHTPSHFFSDPSDVKGLSRLGKPHGGCCAGTDSFTRQGHNKRRCDYKIVEVRGIAVHGLGVGTKLVNKSLNDRRLESTHRFSAFAVPKGSAKSSEPEETIPSWANPDSDEPPPWARDDGKQSGTQQSFDIPFYIYLLGSAITAIAAIGSAFEYLNKNPVFGMLESDNLFYSPLLGFFFFTGIPTSGFLWFKSVQAANKEAEEQDKRDGFL